MMRVVVLSLILIALVFATDFIQASHDLSLAKDDVIDNIYLYQLKTQNPMILVNFQKHFLLRTRGLREDANQNVRDQTEKFRSDLSIILDYVYLFHTFQQSDETEDVLRLKNAVIEKISDNFENVLSGFQETVESQEQVKTNLRILRVFLMTLHESVTIFIPQLNLRDSRLREVLLGRGYDLHDALTRELGSREDQEISKQVLKKLSELELEFRPPTFFQNITMRLFSWFRHENENPQEIYKAPIKAAALSSKSCHSLFRVQN